jgi:sugar-specific transcriptional regulator TrmB
VTTNAEASEKPTAPAIHAISTGEAISMFEDMLPSKEVVMRHEMEEMFPSIIAALKRDVSKEQIIAGLRKKWPSAHVSSIVKLLNSERERRLAHGEPIECKPFGSPRKTKIRTAAMTGEICRSANTSHAASHTTDNNQPEVSA